MRQWFDLVQVETQGNLRNEELLGYAYQDANDENGILHVLDLSQRELGYLLADHHAFRFEWKSDADTGKRTIHSRDIGSYGREGGVRRILEVTSGTIELRRSADATETANGS